MELQILGVENKEGKIVVSSRDIAKQLGKEHKHILEAIKKLGRDFDLPKEGFIHSEYIGTCRIKQDWNIYSLKMPLYFICLIYRAIMILK